MTRGRGIGVEEEVERGEEGGSDGYRELLFEEKNWRGGRFKLKRVMEIE